MPLLLLTLCTGDESKENKAALNVREFDLLFNIVPCLSDPVAADIGAGAGAGCSSNATTKAREAALASIAANNRLVAANTAQRIAVNAAGTRKINR
jgi:hypothetical protein